MFYLKRKSYKSSDKQSGFSIVELMIVSLLGIIISGIIFRIMISTNNTMGITEAQNQATDSGRFALQYISRFTRDAGYFEHEQNQAPLYFDETVADIFNKNSDTANGDTFVTVSDPDSSNQRACNNTTSDIADSDIILNIFTVKNNALWCKGYNLTQAKNIGDNQEIVKGIDTLHILYGISADNAGSGERATNRFVSADALSDADKMNISAVRIAILASSIDESSKSLTTPPSYAVLDAELYQFDDQKVRQIFSTTVALNYFINEVGL